MNNGWRFSMVCMAAVTALCDDGGEVSEAALDRIYLGSRPSVSPDGTQFAFEWCDNVWLAPVKGGLAKPLQAGSAKNIWPVIAPDGRRAVFQSDRDSGWKLFEVDLDSGGTRQISFHSEGSRPYGWTTDGASILAVAARDAAGSFPNRVVLLPSAGGGPETMLFDCAADEPCLSPDGKKLLFTIEGGDLYRQRMTGSNAAQVWLYEIPEKRFTCLVKRETESRTPLWTPEGTGFYYVSGEGGCLNIRHRLIKGGKETPVTFFKKDSVIHPSLSQDGHTLVFRHLFDFYRMDPTRPDAVPERIMLHAAAPAPRPASRRRYYNTCWNNDAPGHVAFCDDGLQIAFTAGGDLWVMDTVLCAPKRIHGDTRTHERDCVFTPDGSALYYLSDRGDGVALRKAERADASACWWENTTFKTVALLEDTTHRRDLSISPDGTRLAWIEPGGTIVVADTNGVEVARCRRAANAGAYGWSPDSRWLVACLADDYSNSDIWILSADGSSADYNLSRHFSWDGSPCWSPDGKLIAFVGQRPNNQTDLFYVWLNRTDEEHNTFDKAVEAAREAMHKGANDSKKTPGKEKAEPASKPAVSIDFDDLHLRVRRVSLPGVTPAQPFFSHDSRTLAFGAVVKGKSGTYKVVLPDKLEPELLTSRRGQGITWLAKDNRLLWMTENLPAHFEKTFKISVYQETDLNDYQELGFLTAWARLRDWYYDDGFHGVDWGAMKEKYRLAARCAPSHSVFTRVLTLLQGELNSSHLGFSASADSKKEWEKNTEFQSWSVVTAHLGLRFDPAHEGPGWKIRDVVPDSPASQVALGLAAGDSVLEVDGTPVSPATDPAAVLNGPENRKIDLTVQCGTNTPRRVTLPATTFSAIREKLKTAAFEATRGRVRQASDGQLGYLNIQRMKLDDYYRFEQDIFAEGFGKDGMIIDVRDNTGGFVADRILSVLCGSVHSIAVERGAMPAYLASYWGRPVWDKPIVVLCNQNTVSNGEIFTHAIKTLKRGKVVGVPTNGGVIATSDTALLDLGTLRLPHRGWFLLDGTDMELNGAKPDVLVWNEPGDIVAGKDLQLDAAIDVLKREVESEKKKTPPVTIRYAR